MINGSACGNKGDSLPNADGGLYKKLDGRLGKIVGFDPFDFMALVKLGCGDPKKDQINFGYITTTYRGYG